MFILSSARFIGVTALIDEVGSERGRVDSVARRSVFITSPFYVRVNKLARLVTLFSSCLVMVDLILFY